MAWMPPKRGITLFYSNKRTVSVYAHPDLYCWPADASSPLHMQDWWWRWWWWSTYRNWTQYIRAGVILLLALLGAFLYYEVYSPSRFYFPCVADSPLVVDDVSCATMVVAPDTRISWPPARSRSNATTLTLATRHRLLTMVLNACPTMTFVCDHHVSLKDAATVHLPYCLLRSNTDGSGGEEDGPPWLALLAPFDLVLYGSARLVVETRRAPVAARVHTARWPESTVYSHGGRVRYHFHGQDAYILQLLVAELDALGYKTTTSVP